MFYLRYKIFTQVLLSSRSPPKSISIINRRGFTKFSFNRVRTNDAKSSVVALNVGKSISIERFNRVPKTGIKGFKPVELPHDLSKEALLLKLEPSLPLEYYDNPLNDVFVFREGTVVFWGLPEDQQKTILNHVSSLTVEPNPSDLIRDECENLNFEVLDSDDRTRLDRDVVRLGSYHDPQMRLLDQFAISHAIASSVKLAVWELRLDDYIKSIDWVTEKMEKGENLKLTRAQVFEKTGQIYKLKHKIISSDLLDLPDVYWDRHQQEVLYMTLISFLNIKKRTAVMNEKLNNCCELMNLLATHMNDKHHVRLEWMIILLILVEVIFEIVKK